VLAPFTSSLLQEEGAGWAALEKRGPEQESSQAEVPWEALACVERSWGLSQLSRLESAFQASGGDAENRVVLSYIALEAREALAMVKHIRARNCGFMFSGSTGSL
jgi:hypothetical protein